MTTAVIPAAGRGTRLLPLTLSVPKELLPLRDRPAIHYVGEEAHAAGIKKLVIVVSPGKESVAEYFQPHHVLEKYLKDQGQHRELALMKTPSRWFDEVQIAYQEQPLGLGHAVLCAAEYVSDDYFAVMLPDDLFFGRAPCLKELIKIAAKHDCGAVSLLAVPPAQTSRYGIIAGDALERGVYRISQAVEKPPVEEAASNLAIMGRYVLPREIFSIIEKQPATAQGEIQLTGALQELIRHGRLVGQRFTGERLDLGTLESYLEAQLRRAAEEPATRALMQRLVRYRGANDEKK